jgi:hypothetical protein
MDLTSAGVGLIFGTTGYQAFNSRSSSKGSRVLHPILVLIGLGLIVGSRYHLFG